MKPLWQAGLQWRDTDLHHVGPPKVRFSQTEVLHLLGAVVILGYAFALILDDRRILPAALLPEWDALAAAFLAVASGFVLHEIAHKIVAQRYGHWAEFRAQFGALGISAAVAATTGLLFAAPGAVMIQGRVTPRENGIISIVGPGTNFVIAALCLPLFAFSVQADSFGLRLAGTVTFINALLAVFNLLPFGPFDGRKVWRWNPLIYVVSMTLSAGLLILSWQQGALP